MPAFTPQEMDHRRLMEAARLMRSVPAGGVSDPQRVGVPDPSTEIPVPETPEEQRSMFGQLGETGMSALGAVGNLLDLPGSMVRDVLAFENPFDQLLSPFSHEDRVTGRDLLTQYGIADANKETGMAGWVDDPMEGVRDIGGFFVETALDPLNLLFAPAKVGAKIAAEAGEAAARVGAKEAAKVGAKAGAREAAEAGAKEAAKTTGRGVAAWLTDPLHLSELGEAVGVRKAVKRGAVKTFERLPDRVQKALKNTQRAIREKWRETMSAPVRGMKVTATQDFAAHAHAQLVAERVVDQEFMVRFGDELKRMLPEDAGEEMLDGLFDRVRDAVEGKPGAMESLAQQSEEMPGILNGLKERLESHLAEDEAAGLMVGQLKDEITGYFPRYMTERIKEIREARDGLKSGGGASTAMGTTSKAAHAQREELYKDGYTTAFNRLVSDTFGDNVMEGVDTLVKSELEDLLKEAETLMPGVRRESLVDALTGNVRDVAEDAVKLRVDLVSRRLQKLAGDDVLRDMKVVDTTGGLRQYVMRDSKGRKLKMNAATLNAMDEGFDYAARAGDYANLKVGGDVERVFVESIEDGVATIRRPGEAGVERVSITGGSIEAVHPRRTYSRTTGEGEKAVTQTFTHEYQNRFDELARHMIDHPEEFQHGGIFGNSIIKDWATGTESKNFHRTNARALKDFLRNGFNDTDPVMEVLRRDGADLSDWGRETRRGEGMTLRKLFKGDGFGRLDVNSFADDIARSNPAKFQKEIDALAAAAESKNLDDFADAEKALRKAVLDSHVRPDVYSDLTHVMQFSDINKNLPGARGTFKNFFRSATALFKAGVLTHPGRYARDLISGQIANMYNGMFSVRSAKMAWGVLHGRGSAGLLEIPAIREYMQRNGLEGPEGAVEAVRQMYAAHRGHAAHLRTDLDIATQAGTRRDEYEQLMQSMPGIGGEGVFSDLGVLGREFLSGSFRPWDVSGFGGRTKSGFGVVKAGDLVGKMTDDMNRMVGFIESMRRGDDAATAMRKVNRVQLNYDPRTFTPTEQSLKRIFPFYSYMSRQAGYVTTELMTNPTGRLGNLIRAIRISEDPDDVTLPEHVKNQFALKVTDMPLIGGGEAGSDQYLAGFGLMFEDTLSMLPTGGASEFFRNIIARTNPLVKAPAEWAFGRSSFQGGPFGGRDLTSMDPLLGRILTSAGIQEELPNRQAAPAFGSRGLEFALANSPVSRLLSTARVLSDDRKTIPQKAMKSLLGMQMTTVQPQQRRYQAHEIINARLKELGVRPFVTYNPSKEYIEGLPEGQEKESLRISKALIKALEKERERLKAQENQKAN